MKTTIDFMPGVKNIINALIKKSKEKKAKKSKSTKFREG